MEGRRGEGNGGRGLGGCILRLGDCELCMIGIGIVTTTLTRTWDGNTVYVFHGAYD